MPGGSIAQALDGPSVTAVCLIAFAGWAVGHSHTRHRSHASHLENSKSVEHHTQATHSKDSVSKSTSTSAQNSNESKERRITIFKMPAIAATNFSAQLDSAKEKVFKAHQGNPEYLKRESNFKEVILNM
uniref:Uncharacterized protein n=1 Tax=Ditylenchus dipsaci TaxID=166011 RepID=A0A915EH58_9BILA